MPNSADEGPMALRLDSEDRSPVTADVGASDHGPARSRLGFQSGVVLAALALMLALALFGLLSDRADSPSSTSSSLRETPRSSSEAPVDEAWTFAVFPHPEGVCVEVLPEGGQPVGACPLVVPSGDGTAVFAEVVREGGLRTVLFGAVPRDTVVIRAVLDDLTTVAGRVAAAPPGTEATYSLFALTVPGVVSGDVVAVDAAGDPIGRAGIVAVLRHPEGNGVMDRYGNEIGYLPLDLTSAWLERWSPPAPLLPPDAIRDVASLDLRPIVPDVDSWWDQRPDPAAEDAAFRMWWLTYPIRGPLGPTTGDPSASSHAVYPLEHSGAQVATAPDGSWTLVASGGPTPEVGCLQLWARVHAVFACPLRILEGSQVAFDGGPLTVGQRPPALAILGMASPAVDRLRAAIDHEPDVDFVVLPAPEGYPAAAQFFWHFSLRTPPAIWSPSTARTMSSTGRSSGRHERSAVIRGTGVVLREALPWHALTHFVGTAEETGHQAVFVPEIADREAFSTLAGLAGLTTSIRLGTGVVTVRSRRPVTSAMAAATVHEMSGGRFVLGIGSGTAKRSGPASENPVVQVRDYVRLVRAVLAGSPVDAGSPRDVHGFALKLHSEGPSLPIWLGALGDRMVALAGAEADGVILNWCTPDRVARACDTLRSAAEASGRDPSELTVSVYVRACLGLEEGVAMSALRAATAQYASIPHYLRQMERMGLGSEGRQAAEAARAGRPNEVPEPLVTALTVVGGRREWVARSEAFHRAGADLVLVYPVPALDPVSSILGTIMTAAPSPAPER